MRYRLSDADHEWLEAETKSPEQLAERLGCCVTTATRIMVREGYISDAHLNSKYIPAPVQQMWERPCLRCKCTAPRPKNQYVCSKCKEATRKESRGDEFDYL